MSNSSEIITERGRRVIPGGVCSSLRALDPPIVFTRASGAHLWDADGRRYLDYHAAFGAILLGHAEPRVIEAARRAAETLDLPCVGACEHEVMLAERLVHHIPSAEQVLFCSSGSEATAHALRLARAVTGRPLVVKFQGCYHGWHDAVAANVSSVPERLGAIDPIGLGALPQALERLVVLPFNDVTALGELMERRGHEVAAIILEPVLHTAGCIPATDAFARALRRLSSEHGAVLVFDEVVTGFRHHLGGFQALIDVVPDLTTLAKGIANGYPLAALCGPAHLMERFNSRPGGDVMYGGTFNGHSASVAAALTTIAILEEDDRAVHKRLFRLGERLRAGLQDIVDDLDLPAHAVAFGSVVILYQCREPVSSYEEALRSDPGAYVAFHRAMGIRGFFMLPTNLKRNHVTAAHTQEDIDLTLEAAAVELAALARQRSPSAVAGDA